MHVADGCSGFGRDDDKTPIIPDDRLGILRYDSSSEEDPKTEPYTFSHACRDEPYENLKPIFKWNVGKPSNERMSLSLSIFSSLHYLLYHLAVAPVKQAVLLNLGLDRGVQYFWRRTF
jgi:hypothetical protein